MINKDDIGEEVYNMIKNYGNLGLDLLVENDFFDIIMLLDLLFDFLFLGIYSGQYIIFYDFMDVIMNNDILNFVFEVIDLLFVKEIGCICEIFLMNDCFWYIGNSYYVFNGENWYVCWISFMVGNVSDVVAGGGLISIIIFIYELDGDLNDDGCIDLGEYDEVLFVFNEYEFDGFEDEVLIIIFVFLNEEGIEMQFGKYYFVVVQYVGVDEVDQLVIFVSEDYNYNVNNFIIDFVGVE